ncbi:MAG TPA: amidohydrolase family protein [Pyrinomonadaceae bacterium]
MKKRFILPALLAIGSLCSLSVSAQSYSITNARIVTVSGAPIENGTIVVRDGLIESVGANVKPPADAQVFNGSGLTVYPGFFDALTNLGLQPARPQGGGQGAQTQAAQPTSNSNYVAGLRPEESAIDELKAGEAQFETNRNAGFTTVVTVGRDGIFNGQSAVINLAGENVSTMVVKSPFAAHVTFNTVRGQYPASLLGTFSALRQMFLDAQRLQEAQRLYAVSPVGMRRPDDDRSLEALIPVLNRQIPIVFNANREIEIVRALDLAKEFNLRAIIAGGQEAAKVIDRLKAQNVPVLLSVNFPKRTAAASAEADPESMEVLRFRAEAPKTAARLAQAGVKFAFQSGNLTNINDFYANAGKAVENGLSKDAAVRAMTLSPAEILGVENRLGSVEKGKIANLTVVRGDIFSKDRTVTHVFVDGKLFEQKEKPKTPATPAGTAAPTSGLANVGGNYSVTIEIPGQPMSGTLAFTQQGAILSGTMQTQFGTSQVRDGKVTAEGFTFSASVPFGGSTIEIVVKGTVTGNQISGTIDSPQGAIPFSGTKNP